jgi:hypothetical protein
MFNTPILLIAFNRPETTKIVFDSIKKIKPNKLYIAIDGPRNEHPEDKNKINNVKNIFKDIPWECDLFFLIREQNKGCKHSVSEAIDWFFKSEDFGIILEDDCLPTEDFFIYCSDLLQKYKNENQILMITGDNFQDGISRGDSSYYFSKLTHVWGWATWKRAWEKYDVNMSFWPKFKTSKEFKNIFHLYMAKKYFTSIFDSVYNGRIDTWDYQWTACVWYNNGLCITPNKNLVKNIGFGPDATHTKLETMRSKNQRTESILPLTHPKNIFRDNKADEYVFKNVLRGSKISLIKNFFKKLFSLIRLF